MNFIIDIEKRAEVVGNDIVKNNSTIRDTARRLKMSRSTVYNDYRLLKKTNIKLFESAEKIILNNKSDRNIRGGQATKRKYEVIRNVTF